MATPKYTINVPGPVDIFPGGRSVVERLHLAHALYMSDRFDAERLPPGSYRPLDAKTCVLAEGAEILFVRPGGIGDLLFLTPSCRELKKFYPGCRITVACHPKYAEVLRGNPHVDRVIQYPVPEQDWHQADAHVWLEDFIEGGGEAEHIDAVSLVARRCGLPRLSDAAMVYQVAPAEREWAAKKYPKDDRPRVAVQAQASSKCRTYPFAQLEKAMNRLHAKGCHVCILGSPGSVEADEEFLNLTADNLTIRQSAAFLETCDAALAPDSGLLHIAAALQVPTLGLFGPFASRLRVTGQPTARGLDGVAPCAPCFFHSRGGQQWPEGCPGIKSDRCAALSNLDYKRVADTVLAMLEK
jgi:heptosyltransferase III